MSKYLDGQGLRYLVDKLKNKIPVTTDIDSTESNQMACVPVTSTDYQDEYLTLSALGDGTITITIPSQVNSTYASYLSYSKDKSNWIKTIVDNTDQTISIQVSSYEVVYLRGKAKQWCYATKNNMGVLYLYPLGIKSSTNIIAHGNIMSLLYEDDFKDKTTFPRYSESTFGKLFVNNTHLINAENLILPATKLTKYCYRSMFENCTALTTAPKLPATVLDEQCYTGMFGNCVSLTTAPELPATTLGNNCYWSMFRDCTALTTAPELPATTLTSDCYNGMFWGCASLTTAPELPATTLTPNCYQLMFRDCASLTTAPELPATKLTYSCYSSMFSGCSSLTTAPELPATKLVTYCYSSMFSSCSSLTTAPELPATTLAYECYNYMFYNCSSLTTAPELPATTLTNHCYRGMFAGCTSLNSITMLATDISAPNCLTNWVKGVSPTGTFIKSPSMTTLPDGVSGIPSGWTVLNDPDYLTLSALEDGEITITIPSNVNATYASYLSYSKDKSSWQETAIDGTSQTITIPVSSGEEIYLKGEAKQWGGSTPVSGHTNIQSSNNIIASGNIMSLLYGDDFRDKTTFSEGSQYTLSGLFRENTHLINAENLILPATTLAEQCYGNMFRGCTSLTAAPALPATTLATYCYNYMFSDCASLTTAPELPATALAQSCYEYMFYGCSSLITAPELPATTLMYRCYYSMFQGCASLTTAPELPADFLASYSYCNMFRACYNLNSITMLATTITASNCLSNWVVGVPSTGTFTKAASMTSLPTGNSGIPSGWTVIDK